MNPNRLIKVRVAGTEFFINPAAINYIENFDKSPAILIHVGPNDKTMQVEKGELDRIVQAPGRLRLVGSLPALAALSGPSPLLPWGRCQTPRHGEIAGS